MISFCSHYPDAAVKPGSAEPRFPKRNQGLVGFSVMQTPQRPAAILPHARAPQNYPLYFRMLAKV